MKSILIQFGILFAASAVFASDYSCVSIFDETINFDLHLDNDGEHGHMIQSTQLNKIKWTRVRVSSFDISKPC